MAFLELTNTSGETRRVLLEPVAVNYLDGADGKLMACREATSNTLAAVYHSKRSTTLLSWGYQVILVNRCKVVVFKIIRDGDQAIVGPYTFIFRELETEVLTDDSELVKHKDKRCLVDRKSFKPGDKVIYCPVCGSAYHERCWQYQKGRCANSKACQYQAQWDEPEA